LGACKKAKGKDHRFVSNWWFLGLVQEMKVKYSTIQWNVYL
jgi:hypothetical protein